MTGTILCDVTDPLAGRSAAGFASALGGRLGLRLVLVYVVPGAPAPGETAAATAERAFAAILRGLRLDAETRLAAGAHAEALARVADEEGADLIVVGARPAGLGGRNLRASLLRDLEAATPVPVVVAPPSTRERSGRRLATR
jgi:nucleotide-binding universal stress UspA family protein